jgi:hypothetical protein
MPTESGRAWPLSPGRALALLAAIAAISVAVRIGLAREVRSPFVFMDELGYEQMAKSLVRSGNLALFGKSGSAYNPLYSVALTPIYALTDSAPQAYLWSKVVNAILMSSSVFPVYGVARFVLSRARSVGVAALSLVAPLMFYTDLELSENLAYPLALVAIWVMLRAVRDASPRNDTLLLGAIVLASAARLQSVALLPAALTAVVLMALVKPESTDAGRGRATLRAILAHRILFGVTAVALVAILVRTLANGGALPLAGRYSNVGSAHASPLRVLELAGQHLAALDFALGIVPFAGSLLAGYALARLAFPRRGLIFGSVALAVTVWFLLEVAFDAAAFDTGKGQGIPRIHERYLIYVMPLFLVALVASLRSARPRVGARVHVAVAVAAALLPAAIPFSRVINYSIVADSFGLQIFGTGVAGRIAPISHPVLVALGVGGVFGIAYLYALVRPRPSFAIVVTVIAFLLMSTLVRDRIIGASKQMAIVDPLAHVAWVDRSVDGGSVVLVGGEGARRSALLDTAFDNFSISRVYYTCTSTFGSGFGDRRLVVDGAGRLSDGTRPVAARFAVVPAAFDVDGRVLARDRKGGLVLIAPSRGLLTIPAANRRSARCAG